MVMVFYCDYGNLLLGCAVSMHVCSCHQREQPWESDAVELFKRVIGCHSEVFSDFSGSAMSHFLDAANHNHIG